MPRVAQAGWVFVGGLVGTALRELVSLGFAPLAWAPAGVVTVNLVGAFALGVLVAAVGGRQDRAAARARLVFGTGVLGGFTTYSALAELLAAQARSGSLAEAAVTGGGILVLGGLATFGGMMLGTRWVAPLSAATRGQAR